MERTRTDHGLPGSRGGARRLSTQRRWQRTIIGFVAAASLLEILLGSALAFHFGTRVIGQGWLKGVAESELPNYLRVVHGEMTAAAMMLAEDPRVAAVAGTPAIAVVLPAIWHAPPGRMWIALGNDGEHVSDDPRCTHAEVPRPTRRSGQGAATIAWCGDEAFIGVVVPMRSGELFYGRALDDAFLKRLQPITTTELALVRGDGSVIATTMRATNGAPLLSFANDLHGFSVVTGALSEPYAGLPAHVADEDRPSRGATNLDWLVYKSPFVIESPPHVVDLISFVPEQSLTQGTTSAAILMLLIAVVVVLFAFVIARRLVASFTKPLTEMTDAAQRLAAGATDVAVAEHGDAEVASLARSFNHMVRDLNASRASSLQRDKMMAVGQLASGIAHELNTPAQYVGDNISFVRETLDEVVLTLRNGEALTPAQIEALIHWVPGSLESASEGLRRMTAIVGAMKSFAHPSHGVKEPTALRDVVAVTAEVARNEWRHVAELAIDLDADLVAPVVRDELGQVLLNLIVNAAHAIGDRVGDSGAHGVIAVRGRRSGAFVELTVSDDGVGIAPENLGRVFEAFFTTKGVGKGTGQGLSLAWSIIVDRHGGTIGVKSTVGKGTTFTIRLPARPLVTGLAMTTTTASNSAPVAKAA
jgi:two-component system, NtrC family, sensor kinase